MIIDGHAHLGGEYRDGESIIATLDAAGADRVLICPADRERTDALFIPGLSERFSADEPNFVLNRLLRRSFNARFRHDHIDEGNEKVYNTAMTSGGRIMQSYWADLCREDVLDKLEMKYQLWHFRGIKLHQSCNPFTIKSSAFRELAEFAGDLGLPVFIHLHSRKDVADFIAVSKELKTVFIPGHLIGLDIFIENKSLTGENVFFDISCPPLVPLGRVSRALNAFGPGRLLMGSDTPYGRNNTLEIITRIRSMSINEAEKDQILGNTLKHILRI